MIWIISMFRYFFNSVFSSKLYFCELDYKIFLNKVVSLEAQSNQIKYLNAEHIRIVPVPHNFEHFEQISKQRLGEKAIKFRESWQSFVFLPFVRLLLLLLLLLQPLLPFIGTSMSTHVSYCHSM